MCITKLDGKYFSHPAKWRDTIDPYTLNYHLFQLKEILGYPHAGNDVFHVKGILGGEEITAYIKAERQTGAAVENEAAIIRQINDLAVPRILDADFGDQPFIVSRELPGMRLSVIVGENKDLLSLEYMEEYGEMLGRIHSLTISANSVADRKFFHVPSREILEKLDLAYLNEYFENIPPAGKTVFCHGDFHYANLLWEDHHISGILDFELAGYGDRDFDIALAILLRPGQKFLKTREEQKQFFKGYAKYGEYNWKNIQFYMAQCYVYFLSFSGSDEKYCSYVKAWLRDHCNKIQ